MIKSPILNKKPTQINRALLSVFDKEGIVTFCESGTMSKSALANEVNAALE